MKFRDIPQFTRTPTYYVNQSWRYIGEWIETHLSEGLNLDPDFQRAHVWTEQQQIRYVEFRLKGGASGKDLYFNHPNWMNSFEDEGNFVLVDGKQRLNAVMRFMNNEIPAFGTLYKDFEDRLSHGAADFVVHINDLKTRAEVLQWYIDLNAGGVAHTDEEIEKVQNLLDAEHKKN